MNEAGDKFGGVAGLTAYKGEPASRGVRGGHGAVARLSWATRRKLK